MKHLFFLFAIVVAITACNSSDQKAQVAANPKDSTTIQWMDPITQDIGKVVKGEVVEILWHFKNSGNKPLVVNRVTPGCGCTGAEGPKEPIAPGKEGIISAKFDSQNFEGTQHKTVTVSANYTNKVNAGADDMLGFNVDIKPKQ